MFHHFRKWMATRPGKAWPVVPLLSCGAPESTAVDLVRNSG